MKTKCSKCKKDLYSGMLILSTGGEDFCTDCANPQEEPNKECVCHQEDYPLPEDLKMYIVEENAKREFNQKIDGAKVVMEQLKKQKEVKEEKCHAEENGVKCRPPCESCYGGRQMTASSVVASEVPSWEEKINTAYQDFLDVCNLIAGDQTRTGVEAKIALEKVKNVIGSAVAAAEQRVYDEGFEDGKIQGKKQACEEMLAQLSPNMYDSEKGRAVREFISDYQESL